jgi:hypothetical protein
MREVVRWLERYIGPSEPPADLRHAAGLGVTRLGTAYRADPRAGHVRFYKGMLRARQRMRHSRHPS